LGAKFHPSPNRKVIDEHDEIERLTSDPNFDADTYCVDDSTFVSCDSEPEPCARPSIWDFSWAARLFALKH